MIVTFIPAAGGSTRMRGEDKLLQTIGGKPILRKTALIALQADLGPVIVGVRTKDPARRNALRNLDLRILEVPDADQGMSVTLRAGAQATLTEILSYHEDDYEYSGMMVLLPDMPEITARDLIAMDYAFQSSGGTAVRATTQEGAFGHPTLFPVHLLRAFDDLSGDKGAASLFEGESVIEVALAHDRARTDLDTPEAWAAWRAQTGVTQ